MLVTIEVDVPEQTVRQYEEAGIDWKARARQIVQDGLPPVAPLPKNGELDPKNAAAIAMLQNWLREDATDDSEKIAEAEVAEFKRNMNANRAENGERLLFP